MDKFHKEYIDKLCKDENPRTESNIKSEDMNFKDLESAMDHIWHGIPIVENPLVSKNTILFVKDKEIIAIMVDVLNSKLYRFIIWYQGLFKKIIKLLKALLEGDKK